jgi:hypothetical protein
LRNVWPQPRLHEHFHHLRSPLPLKNSGRRTSFAENTRGYHKHIRENDICMTHTLINPPVDRSRPVEKQDKDLAAKIGIYQVDTPCRW